MSAQSSVSGTWFIRAGRRLHWAPSWDDSDAALVFDAASGDYWVLSVAAAEMLRQVSAGEVQARSKSALRWNEAEELLTELQRSGLVDPMA